MFFSSATRESKKSDKFEKLSPPTSTRKNLAIQHILLKLQKKEYKRHDYQKLNDTYLDDN
jgi:hypothetical protein